MARVIYASLFGFWMPNNAIFATHNCHYATHAETNGPHARDTAAPIDSGRRLIQEQPAEERVKRLGLRNVPRLAIATTPIFGKIDVPPAQPTSLHITEQDSMQGRFVLELSQRSARKYIS